MSENEIVAYVERDMEEIIPYFIEDSKAEIKGLVAALKSGDYQGLKDFGHKIKGSSVTCSEGFREMSDIGLAIEEAARERRDLREIHGLVKRFVDYVQRVKIVYVDE
jgi:HPt (histidine-containing phosphotransfer) domain-containing protein